ncbi:hypothetical protein PVAP13_J129801 [Panicum virgatum]|nr:hypothetical protein PVAP13_J129801 [Panicum virgatum]
MGPLVAHAADGGARLRGRGAAAAGAVGAAGVPRGSPHECAATCLRRRRPPRAGGRCPQPPSAGTPAALRRRPQQRRQARELVHRRRGKLRPPARSAGLAVAVGRWRLSWPRPAATKRAGLATTIEMAAATGEAPELALVGDGTWGWPRPPARRTGRPQTTRGHHLVV